MIREFKEIKRSDDIRKMHGNYNVKKTHNKFIKRDIVITISRRNY